MNKYPQLKTVICFIVIILLILGVSIISTRIWEGKPEQPQQFKGKRDRRQKAKRKAKRGIKEG